MCATEKHPSNLKIQQEKARILSVDWLLLFDLLGALNMLIENVPGARATKFYHAWHVRASILVVYYQFSVALTFVSFAAYCSYSRRNLNIVS
jgi:hypothetical protein